MGFRRILIPLDGSALAERAIKYARQIAEPQTVLHLLSVVEEDRVVVLAQVGTMVGTAGGSPAAVSTYAQDIFNPVDIKHREIYMRELAEKLQADGYTVSQQILCGTPISIILDVAQKADLIVMASHGRTGLSRLILGSVAERVLLNAPCPILIIPGHIIA